MRRSIPILLLVFSLTACHDSPRRNPLDPELTPAVELSVAADDTLGIATLIWTPYDGAAAFREYLVLRKQRGLEQADTLAAKTSPVDTSFVDRQRQPETAYEYRVAVVNQAGLAVQSTVQAIPGYTVRGVRLLAAEGDSLAGVVRLHWSRYVGPGFQAYQIQRTEVGPDRIEVLAELHAQSDTSFVDAQARHEARYFYSVVLSTASGPLSSNLLEGHLELPPVALRPLSISSVTAAAALTWEPYRGPRFAAYRIKRQAASEPYFQTLHEALSLTDTSWTDRELLGNTDYTYAIAVLTTAGEEVAGSEVSGRLHPYLGEWPLPLEEGDRVRLYCEEGQVLALVSGSSGIRLRRYSDDGSLVADQILLDWPFVEVSAGVLAERCAWVPGSVCMARLGSGARILAFIIPYEDQAVMLSFDRVGTPLWRSEGRISSSSTPDPSPPVLTDGWWSLFTESQGPMVPDAMSAVTALQVTIDGNTPPSGADLTSLRGETSAAGGKRWIHEGIILYGREGIGYPGLSANARSAWDDWRLSACVSGASGVLSIAMTPSSAIGLPVYVRLRFDDHRLDGLGSLASSDWSYSGDWPYTIPVLRGIPYSIEIAGSDSGWTAKVQHPIRWLGQVAAGAASAAMAEEDGSLFLIAGSQPLRLPGDGTAETLASLPDQVSEVRTWSRGQGRTFSQRLGICLPEQHRVLHGATRAGGTFRWPFSSTGVLRLGVRPGEGPGELLFPISFAPGTEDRLYVLDAGNSRVAVFAYNGDYITHWGDSGSGPGQFSLGPGNTADDLAGSIAVDDQGFIYVADPGNQRIQRFAP